MNIVKKGKKTRRLEDFYFGEAFKSTINDNLYIKVNDVMNEDAPDMQAAVNLNSGDLGYFKCTDEFIPVDCAIVMEE